jgi:hypothetical protein
MYEKKCALACLFLTRDPLLDLFGEHTVQEVEVRGRKERGKRGYFSLSLCVERSLVMSRYICTPGSLSDSSKASRVSSIRLMIAA